MNQKVLLEVFGGNRNQHNRVLAPLDTGYVTLQGCDMVGDLTAEYFNGHDSSRIFLVNHVIHQHFPPTTLSGRLPERANYTPM